MPEPETVKNSAQHGFFSNADIVYVGMTRAKSVLALSGPWYYQYLERVGRSDAYCLKHNTLPTECCSRCEINLDRQLGAVHCHQDGSASVVVCITCLRTEQAVQGDTTTPDAIELLALMTKVQPVI
jgi:hypothetical protein